MDEGQQQFALFDYDNRPEESKRIKGAWRHIVFAKERLVLRIVWPELCARHQGLAYEVLVRIEQFLVRRVDRCARCWMWAPKVKVYPKDKWKTLYSGHPCITFTD